MQGDGKCLYWALSWMEGKSQQGTADEIRKALAKGNISQPAGAKWALKGRHEANV